MGVDATTIEEMRRQGPDWRHLDDKKLMGDTKEDKKPYDPYSAENNPNVRKRLEQGDSPQFKPALRRSFLSRIAGKLGF